ncbi:EAL domain-containing protein [Alteromonas sediminis]|uniref:Sensor protein FixL n=1 Tax=Alteromonas sediminis TaxID=2259342 RepID=A0A3N5YDI3_9ALTE|nr:EAL domain-containing protein [Alteromonas sediminis]RPJ67635.1 EAL domain-containing protein [Alteromonas sediminis]
MFEYKKVIDKDTMQNIAKEYHSTLTSELQALKDFIGADALFWATVDGKDLSTLSMLQNDKGQRHFTYQLNSALGQVENTCGVEVHVYPSLKSYPSDHAHMHFDAQSSVSAFIKNAANQCVGALVALFSDRVQESSLRHFSIAFKSFENLFTRLYQEKNTQAALQLMKEVQSISKIGAWEYNPEKDTVYWTDEVFEIYAISRRDGITLEQAMSHYKADSRIILQNAFNTLLTKGLPFSLELEFTDATGAHKWVRASGNCEKNEQNHVVRVFGAFEDISDEKTLRIQSEERAQKIENILNNINDALITIDQKGVISHLNEVALDMFGYTSRELLGANIAVLMPAPYAEQHDTYMAHYKETGNAKIMGVGRQLPAKRKSGEIFQMELSLSELTEEGEKKYIGVIRDISERIKAQDTIYNLAFTDNVTGLRNSQWFEREVRNLSNEARRKQHGLFVLLLDIDKMKVFNHKYGFNAGDEALKQIARNLKKVSSDAYSLYKYNADAFIFLAKSTFLMTEIHKFESDGLKDILLKENNFDVQIGQHKLCLTASLGSIIFDPSAHSFESMLNILEQAVRQSKLSAPFGYHHIAKEGIDQHDRYVRIKDALDSVADSGELSLVYQPQYDVDTNVVGFEALVRWHSKKLGFVSPGDFIPLAEESSAIISIGDWVIDEAISSLAYSIKQGAAYPISINISAKQIVEPSFSEKFLSCINFHQVPPQLIVIELTETALVLDISVVKQVMVELSNYGVQFSIDDFGTGYSSLAYLKELPISEVKVDKYFVDDINASASHQSYKIVDAIINISNALGVRSVAEGVEREIQKDYLARKGCHIFQGYFFSKPLNKEQWMNLIAELSHAPRANEQVVKFNDVNQRYSD